MKKKLYRMMSALCALVLMVQTMAVTTGFADTATTYTGVAVGITDIAAAPAAAEIFYYRPAKLPAAVTPLPQISGFDAAKDYLELSPAAGLGVTMVDNGTDTTVTVTETATTTSRDVFVVAGITAENLTKRLRPACTALHNGYTVSADKESVKLSDNQTATIKMSAVPAFSGGETNSVHINHVTHDKVIPAVNWLLVGTVPNGITINPTTGVITIPTGVAVGTHTFNAKATATTGTPAVTGEKQITVMVGGSCNMSIDTVNLTLNSNNIHLAGNVAGEIGYTLTPTYTGQCTLHGAGNNHDITPDVTWATSDTGVTVDTANKKIKVASTVPNGTQVTVTATVNISGRSPAPTAAATFGVSRATSACGVSITGIDISMVGAAPGATTIDLGTSTTKTQQFGLSNVTFTGTCNTSSTHTPPTQSSHGEAITWSINPPVAGVTIDANGLLTATAAQMTAYKQAVTVRAVVGSSFTATKAVTIYKCNKLPNNLGAITAGQSDKTTSPLIKEATRSVLAAVDTTVNLPFSLVPTYSGTCGYEGTGVACPAAANHTVTWSFTATPSNAGIAYDTVIPKITVTNAALAYQQTTVKITATMGGKSTDGYVVVNKGAYTPPAPPPAGNDDDYDYEEQKRQEQYDKIEDQIAYAERKDTVKANLSANPKLPTRIMRDLRGQDINLELYMGNGFTWRVNGKNLKPMPQYQIYINFDVKKIRDGDISEKAKDHDIEILELGHEGDMFGTYRLETRLGSDYAKKTVYLYKHLDNSTRLSYKGAAKVDEDGFVVFPFTSASTYIITDRALYGETVNTVPGGGTAGGGGTTGGGSGAVKPTAPPASVAPTAPPSSVPSSSESSSAAESIAPPSSEEQSKPADAEPEEKPEPEKKKSKIPIIVPILLVVVTITIVAVILLTKGGGMDIGG